MPHVNKRIPDLGHKELGPEEWDTDYVVKKGATDPFKIRKQAIADLKSLYNMPAIAPLKFPIEMGWKGIETLLPKKKQYKTIELNTAKEGDFSATLEDSEEVNRQALLQDEDLSLKDTPLWGIKKDNQGNLIMAGGGEYVNELKTDIKSIPKIPEGSTKPPISYAGKTNVFTIDPKTGKAVGVLTGNQRKAFENSLAGRTDVQGTNDQINPSWNKNQSQASVQGLKSTEATTDPLTPNQMDEFRASGTDLTPNDWLERQDRNPGMHEWNTDMDIDAPAEPVSGMSAGGAMAINAGVKLLQGALADKDRKDAETTRTGQLLASAMGKAGNQRTSQLGWMDEYNLWKRFTG